MIDTNADYMSSSSRFKHTYIHVYIYWRGISQLKMLYDIYKWFEKEIWPLLFNVQMQYVTGLRFSRKFDIMFYICMGNFHIKTMEWQEL